MRCAIVRAAMSVSSHPSTTVLLRLMASRKSSSLPRGESYSRLVQRGHGRWTQAEAKGSSTTAGGSSVPSQPSTPNCPTVHPEPRLQQGATEETPCTRASSRGGHHEAFARVSPSYPEPFYRFCVIPSLCWGWAWLVWLDDSTSDRGSLALVQSILFMSGHFQQFLL